MNVLEIENLKKYYAAPDGGRSLVVDVPQFTCAAGEQTAMAGTSGSGKTTLLNLIAGILRADSGSVRIMGVDLEPLPESRRDQLRGRHIGYIFQTFNLLQGYTALENVELAMMFGKGGARDRAVHLLERVGLKNRLHYRPRQLSVGQQQRVAVARALANSPEIVLADEPTGNLDHRHAREALELIRTVCREADAALVLVSHDREILEQFERVVELSEINRAAAPAGAAA